MMTSLVWFLFGLMTVTAVGLENVLDIFSTENPKPVFLLHGVLVSSKLYEYLETIIKLHKPGIVVFNSKAYEDLDSLTPVQEQIDGILGQEFRNFSDEHPGGFHLIGHSQGALISRLLIQSYPKHNVCNFISLAGPQGGVFGFPLLLTELQGVAQFPPALDASSALYYTPEYQKKISVANYWKDPQEPELYIKNNTFLPYYNNEIWSEKSACYREAILKLKKFITIFGPDDGAIYPWESSDFSYYDRCMNIVNITQRQIYTEDRLGLRTLDEEGRFIRHVIPGIEHNVWMHDDVIIEKYILPYLD